MIGAEARHVRMALAIALAAAVLLPGCASAPTAPRPADWSSLNGRQLVNGPYVLRFEQEFAIFGGYRIAGTGGCNWFTSPGGDGDQPPSLDANSVLHIGGSIMTLRGCLGGRGNESDRWLLDLLSSAPRVSIDGKKVIFTTETTVLTMTDGA